MFTPPKSTRRYPRLLAKLCGGVAAHGVAMILVSLLTLAGVRMWTIVQSLRTDHATRYRLAEAREDIQALVARQAYDEALPLAESHLKAVNEFASRRTDSDLETICLKHKANSLMGNIRCGMGQPLVGLECFLDSKRQLENFPTSFDATLWTTFNGLEIAVAKRKIGGYEATADDFAELHDAAIKLFRSAGSDQAQRSRAAGAICCICCEGRLGAPQNVADRYREVGLDYLQFVTVGSCHMTPDEIRNSLMSPSPDDLTRQVSEFWF